MSINLSNIAILKVKNADYQCIINGISKGEAIKLMQNIDLTEKAEHKNLLSYMKIGKTVLISGDTGIEKNKFYHRKSPIFLEDRDIEKLLVSMKIFYGEKKL